MPSCIRTVIFCFIAFVQLLWNVPQSSAGVPVSVIDSLRVQVESRAAYVDSVIDSIINVAAIQHDSSSLARLLDTKGQAKRNLGQYAEAIQSYHRSYDIYQLQGNLKGSVYALNSLGIVMIRTTQYDEAEKYLLSALSKVNGDSVMLKTIYTNLGVTYDYWDKTLKAVENYKKALTYVKPDDYYSLGVLNLNIGVCYDILKNFRMSEEYFFHAMELEKKEPNADLRARICISLGDLYLNNNHLDDAIRYFELGGQAAAQSNTVELEEKYLENLVNLYVTKKDSKKALEYIDKLNKLKAKIYSKENSRNITEAETRFDLALKNKEIENLKISKSLADLKNDRDRLVRNIMMVLIGLSLVIIFVMFRNYKLRRKNFTLLRREKQLIENEKKALEKNNEYLNNENILAKFEILKSQVSPHFLFNTLNALSYLIVSDTDKAVKFTNAFSQLFRIVLELKDKNLITLEQELQHVEAYFFLQHIRFNDNLKVSKQIDHRFMALKLPPFSIQMAVENALNHNMVTPEKPLYLNITGEDNFLIIENNLQLKTHVAKSTSIGISNIRARYSFFTDIKPEFNRTTDKYVVRLPLLEI